MKINKATKIIVIAYGIILALAGIEHGIGEILQRNTKPDSPSLIIITSILAFLMIFVSIVSAYSYDTIQITLFCTNTVI